MTTRAATAFGTTRLRRCTPTLRTLANIMAGGLALALAVLGIVGGLLLAGMRDIQNSWNAYDLGAATKSDALSELRSCLGAGGVVDLFHDFQVSGPRGNRAAIEQTIAKARANLETYRFAAPPPPRRSRRSPSSSRR